MLWLLLLLGCPRSSCDEPGTICTIAGTGINGYNGEDLPATESQLYYPSSLALDAAGRLVVDDFNNFLIRRFDEDGTLRTIAGNNVHGFATEGPALNSPLENPVDIAVGPDGTLYVAELHAGRVLAVADGDLSVIAGSTEIGDDGDGGPALEALLSELAGVEVDADGTVYVADTDNHRIRVVHEGIIETLAGGEEGFADGPLDEARFARPQRMHLDGQYLYVADTDNHAVRRVDLSAGTVETVVGTGEAGYDDQRLDRPYGVFARDGVLWIADSGNHVVRRLEDGGIETIAGTAGESGHAGDLQPATDARLTFPSDVLVLEDGTLFVADMQNGAVRRVAPPEG